MKNLLHHLRTNPNQNILIISNILYTSLYWECPDRTISIYLYQVTNWTKVLFDMYDIHILCANHEYYWFSEDVIFCQNQRKHQRRQKKLKAYNLSSLLDTLPELNAPQKPCNEDNFKVNCKTRQKLVWVFFYHIQ